MVGGFEGGQNFWSNLEFGLKTTSSGRLLKLATIAVSKSHLHEGRKCSVMLLVSDAQLSS